MKPLHGRRPCASCPFLLDAVGAFPPDVLDRTVGENLRAERHVHRCHKTLGTKRENLCVGFLRFVRDQNMNNALARFGTAIGVIDYAQIKDEPPIAGSWKEVLDTHAARLALEVP